VVGARALVQPQPEGMRGMSPPRFGGVEGFSLHAGVAGRTDRVYVWRGGRGVLLPWVSEGDK